jgi:hypothetical protein
MKENPVRRNGPKQIGQKMVYSSIKGTLLYHRRLATE